MHLAMVAAVDDVVGALLDQLKQQGLEQDTVVWFQSDNGATREARASSDGKPYNGGSNAPYRGWKQGLFDGGMHVPAILRAPGVMKAGARLEPADDVDGLAAELLVAGGRGRRNRQQGIDGQNIFPVLRGAEPPHEYMFWSYNNQRAVRYGDWKLILNPPNFPGDEVSDKVWLSNLEADPGEKRNLAAQQPARVRELTERIRAWERDVGLGPE